MEKIISVDVGKSYIKYTDGEKVNKFENLVLETESENKPSNANSYEVILDEKRYLVGNKVSSLREFSSNKIIETNKIAMYTAIALLLEKDFKEKVDVKLVTGLPNQHFSKENEKKLKELIASEEVKISVNNKEIIFSLLEENIIILTENFTIEYHDVPKTLLLDIGFRNVNINLLEDGEILQNFMKNSESGIIDLKTKIANELEKIYNKHYELEEITDYIVNNGLPHDEDSLEAIKKGKINYLKELINQIEKFGIKIDLVNKIAIRGGGTKLFKMEELETIFPRHYKSSSIVIEGDEFKNVMVFKKIGDMILGGDRIEEK